jgi:hypothetical protein
MSVTIRPIFDARVLALIISSAFVFAPAYGAETTADPAATADTYSKQATELRSRAEQHQKMARTYRGMGHSKGNHGENIARHCDRIAANLLDAAKESDELAQTLRNAPAQ